MNDCENLREQIKKEILDLGYKNKKYSIKQLMELLSKIQQYNTLSCENFYNSEELNIAISNYCENCINKLNKKVYSNFFKNQKDKENLIQLYFLFGKILNINAFHNGVFKIKIKISDFKNKTKNQELAKLVQLIYSVPEIFQNIKNLKPSESPDFIITTHNSRKIGLELAGIDLPEEVRDDMKGNSSILYFAFHEIPNDIFKKIENSIEKKKEKLNKYDENWLFLYIRSSKSIAEAYILEKMEVDSYIKQLMEQKLNQIKVKYRNIFQRIYFMTLERIKEIITGKEFLISQEWHQYVRSLF